MSPVEGRRVPGPAAAEAPAARRATDAGDREGRAGGAAGSEVGPRARRRAESLFERSSYQYTALLECIIYYNDYWIRYAHNVWHLACMSPACRALAVVVRTLRSSHLQIWLLPQGTRGDLHEQDGTRSVMCRESRRLSRRRVVCG